MQTGDLFTPDIPAVGGQAVISSAEIDNVSGKIPGLDYKLDYITEQEGQDLLAWLDKRPWITDLKRRVQHYGWRYDYKARKIDSTMRLGALPDRLAELAERLYEAKDTHQLPDQVIINEYLPGQGIAPHIDCVPCFGNTIITISLAAACIMEFSKSKPTTRPKQAKLEKEPKDAVPVWLAPRSLVAMRAAARGQWLHGIPARKSDVWNGVKYARSRRVSLTFRTVSRPPWPNHQS